MVKVSSLNVVDLALINGKVITVNPRSELAEAVAVRDGKIFAVGKTSKIKQLVGKGTTVIDLQGKVVTPGFIESHCHPSLAGPAMLYEVDVRSAKTIDDIVEMLRQKAKSQPKGRWLKGAGYNDRRLKELRHPTRWELDRATTEHPVFLERTDTHLAVVNSEALKLSGLTGDTPDPDGGRFDRDPSTGELTGVLRERALVPVKALIPRYSVAEIKEGLVAALHQLARWGFTSAADASVNHDVMTAYQELLSENHLLLRVGLMIPGTEKLPFMASSSRLSELSRIGIRAGFGSERLRVLGTKFICDGSMSGWTAALYEPYADVPAELGIIVLPEAELAAGILEAHQAGLRPLIHAIGDRAIDITLDCIEKALEARPVSDHRIRIEHCSIPTDKAIERIKRLGIIPSSSVGFIYELGPAHLVGLGQNRLRNYFPHRTYIEKGIIAVGNSDWPVTRANITQQIGGLVTRKSYTGDVLNAGQAIPVLEAIRLYTINAAYASFEESIKGSIEPGKLADLVVLDRDILTIPADEIRETTIELTIVGGQIIYQRDA